MSKPVLVKVLAFSHVYACMQALVAAAQHPHTYAPRRHQCQDVTCPFAVNSLLLAGETEQGNKGHTLAHNTLLAATGPGISLQPSTRSGWLQ